MRKVIARKGQWVLLETVILEPQERAPQVPEDTSKLPFIMRIKGFLIDEEASIGSSVKVITETGRKLEGMLVEIEPRYKHDFGDYIPELSEAGQEFSVLMHSIQERDDL